MATVKDGSLFAIKDRLRLPGRLMFLFRIRFGLFAVLSRLQSVNDWAALEHGFAEESGLAAGSAPA